MQSKYIIKMHGPQQYVRRFFFGWGWERVKQKFDGEGVRFSFESKEKQKSCVCRRKSNESNEKQSCSPPLPGRPAKLAMLCAKRTAKNRWTDQKMNVFIFWLALGFSYARKLSLRLPSYRRKLFVVIAKPVRPLRSRR